MYELQKGMKLKGGTYTIQKKLGQGSFGITYLATMSVNLKGSIGKMAATVNVAVKEFFMTELNSRSEDGSMVTGTSNTLVQNYQSRFYKEAGNLAKLDHPNIVKVLDVFDENNTTYYIMEFVEGESFDSLIKRKGHLTELEALKTIKEMAGALKYMHDHQMLHLDLKPKNVMLDSEGTSYIIDFGLSKQFDKSGEPESSTTVGHGTPGYAPLEQVSYVNDGTFPATLDIYALGATMFKALTGKTPPSASQIYEDDGVPKGDFVKYHVGQDIVAFVEKAMNPKRKLRYQTADEVIEAIDKLLEVRVDEEESTTFNIVVDNPIDTPKPSEPAVVIQDQPKPSVVKETKKEKKPLDRKWFIYGGTAVVAIVLCIILVAVFSGGGKDITPVSGSHTTTVSSGKQVSGASFKSTLGQCKYSGPVGADGVPHGEGVAVFSDGRRYEGTFVRGHMTGWARFTFGNGDVFEGDFKNGVYSRGKYILKQSGAYFKGTFVNGQPDKGEWYDSSGKII